MFPKFVMIDTEPANVIEVIDKYALAESLFNFYILAEDEKGKHYVAARLSKREYTLSDALREFYDFVRV